MKYLEKTINKAIIELKGFFEFSALKAQEQGWSYFLDDDAPESYSELKRRTINKCIPIATNGSNTSIYGFHHNTLFRFVHDVAHLTLDKSFNEESEKIVINKQLEEAKQYGLSELAYKILYIDTIGQVEYYFQNRKFVNNQETFIHTYLNQGKNAAMAL